MLPKIAIFVSGRGSNLQALIRHAKKCNQLDSIGVIISNRSDAPALAYSKQQGLKTAFIDQKKLNRAFFESKISKQLMINGCNWIFMAGFMVILSPSFIIKWPNIINIHPSLLPLYKGLNTHQRVIEAKDDKHGCTVHLVNQKLDDGPILAQASMPVKAYHRLDCDRLARDVLSLEHQLYPMVFDWVISQKLTIQKGKAYHQDYQLPVLWSEVRSSDLFKP
ncbi:MAG: phosphoribosylglycinamide formyltransferase [Pseudomonadota bacterium]